MLMALLFVGGVMNVLWIALLAFLILLEKLFRFGRWIARADMSVDPLPTMHPSGEMWASSGHPISPDKLAFAVGAPRSTFSDHGMRWIIRARTGITRRSAGPTH
jgi:hypothetical protein